MAFVTLSRFLSLLLIASSPSFGAPLGLQVHPAENSLDERGNAGAYGAVAEIGAELVKQLIEGISDYRDNQEAAQEKFTQGMVARLGLQNPGKNVIIYHDQESQADFQGASHDHFELDIGLGFTKGYETYVFDSGTFTRHGDGGFMNWCFAGAFDQNGNVVAFKSIQVESPPPVPEQPSLPPTVPTRGSTSNDGNYFVNCQKSDGTQSSGVAYYANLNPGNNVGQRPTDYVDVTHGSYYNWEQRGSIVFPKPSGQQPVTVHWSIFGDSQTRAASSSAGTADNGYQTFWAYKDSGNYLYSVDDWTCNSVYWVF